MKILLAVDATPASRLAAGQVSEKPWPEGTEVELLTVVEQGGLWEKPESLEHAFRDATELVRGLGAGLREKGLAVSERIASGDAKRLILARARETKPDLIVMGSHRERPLTDLFLGNVATNTLRHAECSVAIIRRRRDDMPDGRRLLLATDGSADAEGAARFIAARPWPEGTVVRVLSVVEVVLPAMHALFEPPFLNSDEVQRLRAEAMERAQSAVATAAAILTGAGLAVSESISVLLDGTKDVILKEAREWGADRIVVGSHGHSPMERLLMGSVSEAIATQAHCSVEVVRNVRV